MNKLSYQLMLVNAQANNATGDTGLFNDAMGLLKTAVIAGGTIWLVWGIIVLAGALKDKTGPEIKQGIWQVVGGAMILAAAALIDRVAM